MERIGFICIKGGDNFINDIIVGLSEDYSVRKFIVENYGQIKSAIDWSDIVWFEWADQVAIIGTNYSRIFDKKVLLRLHSYEAFTDLPTKINWEAVDILILVAKHIKNILKIKIHDIDSKVKIEIINNGVDIKKFTFNERKKGFNIACVGNINYKKNPVMMLQIIKKLVDIDSRYKLHVAGDFQDLRYKIYLEYMVKEMGLESNVIFYGFVTNINEWLEDKEYLLSTSIHESFGYSIFEAASKGIKPIVHSFYGAKSIYDEKWLYNTIDEAVKMITDSEYNSKSYRKFVEDNYSLEKQLNKIKNVLNLLKSAEKV